jgi:hypothetical protein
MRYTCLATARPQVAAISARVRFRAGAAMLAAIFVLPGAVASADTLSCTVASVGFATEGDLARLTVVLGCGQVGAPIPVNTDLVAGLTVYGKPRVEDDFVQPGPAEWPRNPGGAERILINDDFFDRHDLEAQDLRILPDTEELALTFATPAESVAERPYLLFALWNGDAKEPCDQTDSYMRQGCKDFGYVIGSMLDAALVLAYPGLMSVTVDDGVAAYDTERWVVERFK